MQPRTTALASLAIAAALVTSADASADTFPSHPVTIVVPFPAGGPTDTVARVLAEPMRVALGQPIIIENITGAAGSIGTGNVARAAPTGYTLTVGYLGTHVLNGALYKLSYDVLRDFEPIALLTSNPQLIVKIKAYAVTANTRLAAAPEIPTVDEAGLPGFYASVWTGMWAPKGTPSDVISKLNAAVANAFADPHMRQHFTELGQEIAPRDQQTPEALRNFQKAEIDKWWPIIKAARITGE